MKKVFCYAGLKFGKFLGYCEVYVHNANTGAFVGSLKCWGNEDFEQKCRDFAHERGYSEPTMQQGQRIRVVKTINSQLKQDTVWEFYIPADDDATENHLFIKVGRNGQRLKINNSNVVGISSATTKQILGDGSVVLV